MLNVIFGHVTCYGISIFNLSFGHVISQEKSDVSGKKMFHNMPCIILICHWGMLHFGFWCYITHFYVLYHNWAGMYPVM